MNRNLVRLLLASSEMSCAGTGSDIRCSCKN